MKDINLPEDEETGPSGGDPGDQQYAFSTRCPKCGSTDIICLSAVFEFTHLRCNHCGNEQVCDMYQLDDWQS